MSRHIPACLLNPERKALYLAALDDGTGGCVPADVYDAKRAPGLPNAHQLTKKLPKKSWGAVAEYFGLRPWTRSDGMRAMYERAKQAAKARAETVTPVTRPEPLTVCGMKVCRINDYGDRVGMVLL